MMLAHQIGLFHCSSTDFPNRGWALLSRSQTQLILGSPEAFAKNRAWILREFGIEKLEGTQPFQPMIEVYCRFLQRAHRHRHNKHQDEAFLHFVIALELLFGIEGKSADSLASRVGLLTFRQLNRTLDEQVRQLKKLYDRRSKYVHEGKPTSENDLIEIESVCTEVLWTLLSMARHASFRDSQAWLAHLDYLERGLVAGRDLPESEFESAGIPPPGVKRIPPASDRPVPR